MFCVGTLSNAGTRRKDKMWEGLCQEGENDRIVTGAVAVARLGEFEKFVGGGSARGCAHMAEPFGSIRRSSHLDVYKMVRACCDYCLCFTVLQCYAECHLSPNHPFISAGYGVQSLLPQIEQTLNLFCLGWMASQHCRFQIFVYAVICMRGLPEVISIRLGALHLYNGEVHVVPQIGGILDHHYSVASNLQEEAG
jgi:hypothetical protein